MNNSEQQYLQIRLEISEAAAQLFEQHDDHFTVHQIADKTGYTVAQIFEYFDDKEEMLRFFYSSLIIRYRSMIDEIEDFESYTLSEKLSNFIYASFDLMHENRTFVEATFKPLILSSFKKTEYEKRVQELLGEFFRSDKLISASSSMFLNECTFSLLKRKYLKLVSFWLNDHSEDKELTMELTDKITGFIQEVMYTSAVDRAFDLMKFLYSNSILSRKMPFYNKISSTFEIR